MPTFQEPFTSDQQTIQQLRDTLDQTEQKLQEANLKVDRLKEQVFQSEEYSKGLLEKLNIRIRVGESCQSSDVIINDARNATSGKKVNTVRPLSRPEANHPIILEERIPSTELPQSVTGNTIDVQQLEQQCRNLEEQLDQVKLQIVNIVSDKNDVNKENELLKNSQVAFASMSEQNDSLRKKLEDNTRMLDQAEPVDLSNSIELLDSDRTSPDGQEREKEQDNACKSSLEYEAEIKRLVSVNRDLEAENESVKDLKQKNKDLEESLDLIREEFESMEDYWQKKLDDERAFYEEQLKISERQFKDLESRLKEYDEVLLDAKQKDQSNVDDDKLSTIEETFSLECQVCLELKLSYLKTSVNR